MAAKRTHEICLRLTRRQVLSVKFRRFRTSKATRTKLRKQIVLELARSFRWREIVVERRVQLNERKVIVNYGHVTNLLLVAGLTGVLSFGALFMHSDRLVAANPVNYTAPVEQQKTEPPKPLAMEKSEPVAINVPAISLEANISKVGQRNDGSIEMPGATKYLAGWYENSPTPGEIGPSIIVGHVDNLKGPSVFWNLRKLKVGDSVTVSRSDGSNAVFTVVGVEMFGQTSFPTEKVYGNTDQAELRLITCGGTFSRSSGQYSDNLVVFARLTDTK